MQFVIWVIWLKIYSDDNARLIEDWRTQPDSVVDILTVTVVMHRHSGPVRSALGKLVHLTPNEVGTLMIHICQVTQEISRVTWQYDDIQQLFCFAAVCYRPISTPYPSPHTLPPQPPRTPTRSPTQPTPTRVLPISFRITSQILGQSPHTTTVSWRYTESTAMVPIFILSSTNHTDYTE